MPAYTPARPYFTYPLNGDSDRQIALLIQQQIDLEDSMSGIGLPPTLDDADKTFTRIYEEPDYTFWGW